MPSGRDQLPRRPLRLDRVFHAAPLYFVTFCTENRRPLLANHTVHEAFLNAVDTLHRFGNAVGRYVIMPDHVHVFVRIAHDGQLGKAVKCIRETITKRLRRDRPGLKVWQSGFFDHVMRSSDSYSEKWDYVRNNPVRAGLVAHTEQWPFQGEIVHIRW
jgi:REP element-mobilizing transposase RayT